MFRKPFKIESKIQLKNSDIKKLKAKLSQQLKLTENKTSKIFPAKSICNSVKIKTDDEQQVTIYTVDKKPMIFEINDGLYPTLHTLKIIKRMIPYLTIDAEILPKLYNGEDLKLNKKVFDSESLTYLQKDEIIAVYSSVDNSAIGVGVLVKSSKYLCKSDDQKVFLKLLHAYGDKLWEMEGNFAHNQPEEVNKTAQDLQNLSINDNEQQLKNSDEIFKSIFLSTLKINRQELLSSLPIQIFTFYTRFMKRSISPDKLIAIKDTSYKKLIIFMRKMKDEGFIELNEEVKDLEKIVYINFNHSEMMFEKSEKNAEENNQNLPRLLQTEIYVVNKTTKPLFNFLKIAEGRKLDKKEIKMLIKDYAIENLLLNFLTNEVELDDVLIEIFMGSRRSNNPIIMQLYQVTGMVISKMDKTYEMRRQTEEKKKQIVIIPTLAKYRKITVVRNLPEFDIDLESFIRKCKTKVQASISISKTGTNIDQIQIQGDHVLFIRSLLIDTYKIAKEDILALQYVTTDKEETEEEEPRVKKRESKEKSKSELMDNATRHLDFLS